MPDILLGFFAIAFIIAGLVTLIATLCEPSKEIFLLFLLMLVLGSGVGIWFAEAPVYSKEVDVPVFLNGNMAFAQFPNGDVKNVNLMFGANDVNPEKNHIHIIQHTGWSGGIYWMGVSDQVYLITQTATIPVPKVER